MLTHSDWHDFTLSALKCKEVRKIYRDHPYGVKPYHIVLPYHFILHNTMRMECRRDKLKNDTPVFHIFCVVYFDPIIIFTLFLILITCIAEKPSFRKFCETENTTDQIGRNKVNTTCQLATSYYIPDLSIIG